MYTGMGATQYGGDSTWCGVIGGSVRDVQTKLAYLGFYTGAINGVAAEPLAAASRAFAQHMGITISGGITKAFCQALNAAYASQQEADAAGAGTGVQTTPPTPTPKGEEAPPLPPAICAGNWWTCMSSGKKTAVVMGSVAVLGLLGVLLFAPKSFFGAEVPS